MKAKKLNENVSNFSKNSKLMTPDDDDDDR